MKEQSERQKEIVNKSIELIALGGIQALTIKNISKEIGISEPAIYRHFDSKFAILMSVLDSFELISSNVLDSDQINELTPLHKIEYFLFDRYRRCAENKFLAKVMFSEENFQDDERLSNKVLMIMHQHKDKMHNIITEGQESGEIRKDIDSVSLFRMIFGSMRLVVKQWCLSGFKFDLEAEGRKLWRSEKKLICINN